MPISFSRLVLVLFLILSTLSVFSQRKLLQSLDTTLVSQNKYLYDFDMASFENSSLADKLIDPYNVDIELLSAAIYFEINKWREEKRRSSFNEHSKLDRIAYKYANYYKKYRFNNQTKSYVRLMVTLKKVPKYYPLDFTFIDGFVDLEPIVNYEKGRFYFNDELETSPVDLYFGKFSKDEDFEEEPIELLSYKMFAERYLKKVIIGKSGMLIRSKAYELMAVRAALLKNQPNKKVIPQIKIICLFGAYRNKFILDELE